MKVNEGIDLLMRLFEKAGQRLFPRNIMTSKSNGQITVNSKDEILQRFEEAQFVSSTRSGSKGHSKLLSL